MRRLLQPGTGTQVLLILLLALGTWGGSIARGGFSYDDREVITDNPVIEGGVVWTEALTQDYWHHIGDAGHWRPAATLSLRVDHFFYGKDPTGYHITNTLLHLLVVGLAAAALLLIRRPGDSRWPLYGLALFAAHPVLADSVAWMSGRTSMMSAIGGLIGVIGIASIARRNPEQRTTAASAIWVISIAGVLLALTGKEDGVVFGPLYALLALRISKRAALASVVGTFVAVGLWMMFRAQALGEAFPSAPHATLAGMPFFERMAISGSAVVQAVRMVLLPVDYPPSFSAAGLDPVGGVAGILLSCAGWLVLAVMGIGGLILVLRRRGQDVGASALMVAIAALPMMQIIPIGEILAPRFLYLPLLLAIPLVHATWVALFPRDHTRFAFAALLLACCVPLAWERAGVYASRGSYWTEVLAHYPEDERAWNAIGNARLELGDVDGAKDAWIQAAQLDPQYSRPFVNLGTVYHREKRYEEALEWYEIAISVGKDNPNALANYGRVLMHLERMDESIAAYKKAVRIAPGRAAIRAGLGRAQLKAGEYKAAEHNLRKARKMNPNDASTDKLIRERFE